MRLFSVGLFMLACSLLTADNSAQADTPAPGSSIGLSESSGTVNEWQQAKALYESGKYQEALDSLKAHPSESAQYFHNLGTVLLQLNQPGPALAYLEKANSLRPHDPEIQNNLQITHSALSRLLGKEKLDPASSALESMADRVSMEEVRATLGLLGLVVAILWLRAYLKTRSLKRTLLQPAGLIGLVGFAITIGLYTAERVASAHPPAFLLNPEVIRSGPGDQFVQLSQMEAGIKLRLLGPQSEGWSQVKFSQEGIGWIRTSSLLLL